MRAYTVKRNATVLVIVNSVLCCLLSAAAAAQRSAASPVPRMNFIFICFSLLFSNLFENDEWKEHTLIIMWGKMWSVNLSIAPLAVPQTHTHTWSNHRLIGRRRPIGSNKKMGFSTRVVRSIDRWSIDPQFPRHFRCIRPKWAARHSPTPVHIVQSPLFNCCHYCINSYSRNSTYITQRFN